jgi:hypothetical protein
MEDTADAGLVQTLASFLANILSSQGATAA